MDKRKAIIQVLMVACVALAGLAPAWADTVRVSSGDLDHFFVTIVDAPEAGAPFTIRLEAVDAFSNLIADYNLTGNGVNLIVEGTGGLTPTAVEAALFQGGVALVEVNYTVAEDIVIRAAERNGRASGESERVQVSPADVDHFAITVPPSAQAGEPFALNIVAYDRFGNVVTDYADRAHGITLAASGVGNLYPASVPAREFVNGRLVMRFKYDTAEEIKLTVRDQERPISTTSGSMMVMAGPLSRFVVTAPRMGRVGEPLTLAIEAKDRFGNTVYDYAARGRGVELSSNGVGRLSPETIMADAFNQGLAFITVTYTRAESIIIFANERGTAVSGSSSNVSFDPGPLAAFEVKAPLEGEAGASFPVHLRAVDAFGNTIRDYDRVGTPVMLEHNGSWPEADQQVAPTSFTDGVAVVPMTYRLAERLNITARQSDGPASGVSDPIVLHAGALDHIRVLTPLQAEAGIPFNVRLVAADKYNNRISEYARFGQELVLEVVGSAAREPILVSASRFVDGEALITNIYTRAEKIIIRAADRDGSILGVSEPLFVSGGTLAGFTVTAPAEATAGESFTVSIVAVDAYGNQVEDYRDSGRGVRLSANGVGTLAPAMIDPVAFVSGQATVNCQYFASEIITITATEEMGLVMGNSRNVSVLPSQLDHFIITVPSDVVAGEVFALRLEAQDRYFNTVRGYARHGGKVMLSTDQSGTLVPAEVMPGDFSQGVATANLTFDQVGEFKVLARTNSGIQGVSAMITCGPNRVEQYEVTVLGEIRAGEPFPLRVVPEDAYGNRISNYTSSGEMIQIYTNGNGQLYPGTIDPSMFVDGEVDLNAVYTRAEAVDIMARTLHTGEAESLLLEAMLVSGGGGENFVLTLVGNGEINYQDVRLVQPRLLILDLPNVRVTAEDKRLSFAAGPVVSVMLTQEALEPMPVARLTVALREQAAYSINRDKNIINLLIERMPASLQIYNTTPAPQPHVSEGTVEIIPDASAEMGAVRSVDYYLSKAEGFIRLEKYREALRQVELALRLDPNHARAIEMENRLRRLIVLFGD